MSRYKGDTRLGGRKIGTTESFRIVRNLISNGSVPVKKVVVGAGRRLDHMAHQEYGDSSLWWVIAIASGIGWGLQIPAGTLITIPTNIDVIKRAL